MCESSQRWFLLRCDWRVGKECRSLYNYPPKGRWIVVDIYREKRYIAIALHRPWRDSCFSIYQIRWIKKCCFNFFFWNFRETTRHFSLRSQNSEYPRIFQVTETNQNARKLLSTDLVNTKRNYCCLKEVTHTQWKSLRFNVCAIELLVLRIKTALKGKQVRSPCKFIQIRNRLLSPETW